MTQRSRFSGAAKSFDICPRQGAYLEGETVCGNVDYLYLIAERRAYLEAPFGCVIEAKQDDFEQGAAQGLVEMHWMNGKKASHRAECDCSSQVVPMDSLHEGSALKGSIKR